MVERFNFLAMISIVIAVIRMLLNKAVLPEREALMTTAMTMIIRTTRSRAFGPNSSSDQLSSEVRNVVPFVL
jgi:hypothetical protein